jgi:hypothetical protein
MMWCARANDVDGGTSSLPSPGTSSDFQIFQFSLHVKVTFHQVRKNPEIVPFQIFGFPDFLPR